MALEFRFDVGQDMKPLRPWVNVLANEQFGTVVSEAGGGFSWAGNSRLNQLTPWSNDPVADPPGEWLWLQDLEALPRAGWSLSPDAWALPDTRYTVSHTQGKTSIRHRRGALEVEVVWSVDVSLQIKQVEVHLHNRGTMDMHLRFIGMVEWVMGAAMRDRASTVTAGHLSTSNAVLLCSQREQSAGLGGGTAFWACNAPPLAGAQGARLQWTCDRREFFDGTGSPTIPDQLGGGAGTGGDPCAALSVRMDVPARQSRSQVF